MVRRLSLAFIAALVLAAVQASAVFGAANPDESNCLATFVSNQEAGGVAESITGNVTEAHPFGVVVISFTAQTKAPCFEE